MKGLLSQIKQPNDVKRIPEESLPRLCAEIRNEILTTVSRNGGHLASNLGTVELTVALHRFLTFPEDKLIWDVGHQCYTHKLLSGRREQFGSLRKKDGISGFPKREESDCDAFDTGHSATSLSLAAGMAKARDLQKKKNRVVAVIGDGSLSGGMAYEALNNIGRFNTNVILILNDNEMSISPNVGGMANYLRSIRMSEGYISLKDNVERTLSKTHIGELLAKGIRKTKDSIRQMVIPGEFFEEMGLTYFGPVDGHSISGVMKALQSAEKIKGGVLLHVVTKKGKGYSFAEEEPSKFHGIDPFWLATGEPKNAPVGRSYTQVFGKACCELAKRDSSLVFITAAMTGGTGLTELARKYPNRLFDVGIAEEHAVTFAAGLAACGQHPVVCIYSTFLQRAYDQILHDVCIGGLPVIFAIDRAGLVGNDGETHQGIFDLVYLSEMPGMTVLAPANGTELENMLAFAATVNGPVAIRYPRGTDDCDRIRENAAEIRMGKCQELRSGSRIAISFLGPFESLAETVAETLKREDGIDATLADARFAAPMDEDWITRTATTHELLVTLEEGSEIGGYGDRVSAFLKRNGLPAEIETFAVPTGFLKQASREELKEECGLTVQAVLERIRKHL